ncbi:MAG: toprim domain-containing protein, partial [Hyphomonadaceae bacterium]
RPALIATLRDGDGVLQGVEVKLLSPHGTAKAAVPTPRRVIGKLIGGAVRLAEPAETLVVAEGVETALSASDEIGLPAWALLTADNLPRFEPPAGITHLVIAADNDPAGRAAMEALRARLSGSIRVGFTFPPKGFNDWNDWARARFQNR